MQPYLASTSAERSFTSSASMPPTHRSRRRHSDERDVAAVLRARFAGAGRDGSVSRIPMASAQASGDGAYSSNRTSAVREAIREVEQERHHRRGGHRGSSDEAYDALRRDQDPGADRLASTSPRARSDDRPSNETYQPDAGLLPGVRHCDPSGRGQVQG